MNLKGAQPNLVASRRTEYAEQAVTDLMNSRAALFSLQFVEPTPI